MYDTGVLVRSNFLLPNLPAVVVAAGLRHEDLDDAVTAPVVNDDFSSCTHFRDGDTVGDTKCCLRLWLSRTWSWWGV